MQSSCFGISEFLASKVTGEKTELPLKPLRRDTRHSVAQYCEDDTDLTRLTRRDVTRRDETCRAEDSTEPKRWTALRHDATTFSRLVPPVCGAVRHGAGLKAPAYTPVSSVFHRHDPGELSTRRPTICLSGTMRRALAFICVLLSVTLAAASPYSAGHHFSLRRLSNCVLDRFWGPGRNEHPTIKSDIQPATRFGDVVLRFRVSTAEEVIALKGNTPRAPLRQSVNLTSARICRDLVPRCVGIQ